MQQLGAVRRSLDNLKKKAGNFADQQKKPGKKEAVSGYFASGAASLRFIFSEKENIIFALLQWVSVGVAYYIWTQVLSWIPDEVWSEAEHNELLNIIVVLWSFFCVGLAAYPLGLLTACMNASYIQRFMGRKSTVAGCLKLVLPKSWSLWVFSWLDGWWTVQRIVERLPKKNDHTPLSVKLAQETVYQAWKLASLGFIPSLLCGRSVVEAGNDSLALLKDRFSMLAKLRMGYSCVCWFGGVVGYLGMFIVLWSFPELSKKIFAVDDIYSFYILCGLPLLTVLVFIMLVFRPIYIISACRIYAFYAREKKIEIKLPESFSRGVSAFISFSLLAAAVVIVWLFREQLGIIELMKRGKI